jgi:hypothetical protein
MTVEKYIGLGLMACGAATSSLTWIALLFQHDSATLPFQLALPTAIAAILAGAAAVRIGQRMMARARWRRFTQG